MKRIVTLALILAQIGFFTVCPSLVHAAMMSDDVMQQGTSVSMMPAPTSLQSIPMECCKEASVHLEQANQPSAPITDSPVIIDESCPMVIVDAPTCPIASTSFCATSPPFHERQVGKRE